MTRVQLAAAVVVVTSATGLAAMPAASAAKAGPWKQIGTVHDNFNQPGLTVGADGGLHVVWVRNPTSSTQDVVHTPVSLAGAVGSNTAVQTGWAEVWPVPDLLTTSTELQAFWGWHSQHAADRDQPEPQHGDRARVRDLVDVADR